MAHMTNAEALDAVQRLLERLNGTPWAQITIEVSAGRVKFVNLTVPAAHLTGENPEK